MIDEEATFKKFGYKSTDWNKQSKKRIIVVCDNCGKVREVYKFAYHDLCRSCAQLKISSEKAEKSKELHSNPIFKIKHSKAVKDAMNRDDVREKHLKAIKDLKNREKISAGMQGQDYDAGEWGGFTDKDRPHLVPVSQCIHLNSTFKGCNQHHIMTGVIINIPCDLHRKIWHQMPNDNKKGKNIKEINKLAFEYLLGIF